MAQVIQQGLFGLILLKGLQILPFLGLGLLDEGDHVVRKETSLLVEGISVALPIATHCGQVVFDGGFKGSFCVLARHQTTSNASGRACRSIV